MNKEVKRYYNRDEKGKFTKKAPEKTEPTTKPTYDSIKDAVNSVIREFVDEARAVIRTNVNIYDKGYLLEADTCLKGETGIEVSICCSLTKYSRTGVTTPSYVLYSKVVLPNYDIPAYMLCIAPGMDTESNLVVFDFTTTNTIACIICAMLDIAAPTLKLNGEFSKSIDDSDDACDFDECEMDCPCRCGYHLSLSLDDFDDIDLSEYDDIDGTEIYGIVDDMLMTGSDYAQTTIALLGVKNQYTVILYGKNTVADKIVINCTMLASDNVTMQVNRYGVAYTIPCDDVLSDNVMKICAKHGYDLIHNMLELVKEHDDEIVDGSIMAAESADEIEDRICNNPDFAE